MNDKHTAGAAWFSQFVTGAATAILVVITIAMIGAIALYGGTPGKNRIQGDNLKVIEQFYMHGANAISNVVPVAMKLEKTYWIGSDTAIPPIPDKEAFGVVQNPADAAEAIARAEKLLDGQPLYFSTDMEILPDFGVHYYQDETILVLTWKLAFDNTVYSFSEVKIADPSQFRRYLSGGEYGSGKLVYATEMASTVHSVVAHSGDYFEYRNAGVIVYNGSVCRVGVGADTCYIDSNGNLSFTRTTDRMTTESAKTYVADNHIRFSLAFGPILVENGEMNRFGGYGLGEIDSRNSRAALCQMDKLHYLIVTANAEGDYHNVPTMYEFAKRIHETGCQMAYALDGGQTAAHVFNNALVNRINIGYQRKISDIIYFATAIPNS